MENPATWNNATKLISQIISEHDEELSAPEPICGYSLQRKISLALEKAGMLTDIALTEDNHANQTRQAR